jgi:hypothetical protein
MKILVSPLWVRLRIPLAAVQNSLLSLELPGWFRRLRPRKVPLSPRLAAHGSKAGSGSLPVRQISLRRMDLSHR